MSTLRSRAGGYLRDAGGVNLEKIAVYAALGFGLFLLYKAFRVGQAVTGAIAGATRTVGSAIGTGLYDVFHKSEKDILTAPSYVIWFPNEGKFGAVDSRGISNAGEFTRNGVKHRILAPKSPTLAPDGRVIQKIGLPVG